MRELLALRQEEAQLLGYANFAEVSLGAEDGRVAAAGRSTSCATWPRAPRPMRERDLAELRDFARSELGLADLQSWDLAYASEKLKEARYAFSDQEVKQYFTEPKVLAGLFQHRRDAVRGEHPPRHARRCGTRACAFYRIERGGAQLVGQFYLDPYARTGKRGGAWMDDVRGRWLRPNGRAADAGRAPGLQLRADGVDGKPRAAARTTTSPRCSTSSATACTTC